MLLISENWANSVNSSKVTSYYSYPRIIADEAVKLFALAVAENSGFDAGTDSIQKPINNIIFYSEIVPFT